MSSRPAPPTTSATARRIGRRESPGRRVVAAVLDVVHAAALSFIVGDAVTFVLLAAPGRGALAALESNLVVPRVVAWGAAVLWLRVRGDVDGGGTLGKRAVGLRVRAGGPLRVRERVQRALLAAVEAPLLLLAGYRPVDARLGVRVTQDAPASVWAGSRVVLAVVAALGLHVAQQDATRGAIYALHSARLRTTFRSGESEGACCTAFLDDIPDFCPETLEALLTLYRTAPAADPLETRATLEACPAALLVESTRREDAPVRPFEHAGTALRTGSPQQRQWAAAVLAALGDMVESEKAVPLLLEAYAQPDPRIWSAAAAGLAQLDAQLRSEVRYPSSRSRCHSRYVEGRRTGSDCEPVDSGALLALARERLHAALPALARFSAARTRELLALLRADPPPREAGMVGTGPVATWRAAGAAWALRVHPRPTEEMVQALLAALDDSDSTLADAAEAALRRMMAEPWPSLLQRAAEGPPPVRLRLLRILLQVPAQQVSASNALVDLLLGTGDHRFAHELATTLVEGRAGAASVKPRLLRVLAEAQDETQRQRAATVLDGMELSRAERASRARAADLAPTAWSGAAAPPVPFP